MHSFLLFVADSEAQFAFELLTLLAGLVVLVGFWSFVGRWAYRDACARGRNGAFAAVLVILFFPLGWVLWLALRPPIVPIPSTRLRFSSGPTAAKPPV